MRDFFRRQSKPRLVIGGAITAYVWMLYGIRLTLGTGPMHDLAGNQAPALHYLVGALVVTGAVGVWIIMRAVMANRRRR